MKWNGSIVLADGRIVEDVSIHTSASSSPVFLSSKAALRFLSVVETARIPLHLTVGAPCSASTSNPDTERWFNNVLLTTAPEADEKQWWQTAIPDSPLGILVSVDSAPTVGKPASPRVTELLFYATQGSQQTSPPLTPTPSSPSLGQRETAADRTVLGVHVIALSSGLLLCDRHSGPNPPASPTEGQTEIEGVFLPSNSISEVEIINEPPVRKRRSAADAFDEANERRKKARRKGGEGIAAAAATTSDSQTPQLKHSRSISGVKPLHIQTRPLSRSPSVASSRPATAVPQELKRSSLARSESSPTLQVDGSVEAKNKDLISRIVMAGMRLYGLSQSKRRPCKSGASTVTPGLADDEAKDDTCAKYAANEKNDEDYKLIYHQAFKATCFAFRATLDGQSLHTSSEAVREVVDKLLNLFCSDPLSLGVGSASIDKLTPGGRKAFGVVQVEHQEHGQSPFVAQVG